MSVTVHFTKADGTKSEAIAKESTSLLEAGQAIGLPLEGTCEGQMACSTCHVVVAPEWFDQLPEASEEEEDMLDLAYGVERTSRLSCQIELTKQLDGLSVNIPSASHDISRM